MRQVVVFLKSTGVALLALIVSGFVAIVALNVVYRASSSRAVAISLRSPVVWALLVVALAAGYWEYRRASGH